MTSTKNYHPNKDWKWKRVYIKVRTRNSDTAGLQGLEIISETNSESVSVREWKLQFFFYQLSW